MAAARPIAPLMFGFMFGDVAHGVILAAAGLLLQKKFPALRLLIPGGLFSVGFGFAFGSVLAREDLIPALWLLHRGFRRRPAEVAQ